MSFDPEFNPYAPPKTDVFADDDFAPIYILDEYGGFWRRLGAYAIDYIVTIMATVLVEAAVSEFLPALDLPEGTPQAMAFSSGDLVGWLMASGMTFLYFTMMESSSLQATLGKLALGVKVTDLNGRRISFLRASGRYFAKLLSSMICCIGYLMIAWDARKQGLHDQIAGTLVIRVR